jgi:hypothetical protein
MGVCDEAASVGVDGKTTKGQSIGVRGDATGADSVGVGRKFTTILCWSKRQM